MKRALLNFGAESAPLKWFSGEHVTFPSSPWTESLRRHEFISKDEFEQNLLTLMRNEHKDVLDAIRQHGEMTDEINEKLKGILDDYAKNFA